MRRWVLLALLPALLTNVLDAQEVTGRIEGRVLGTDGASLSQVEVTASGPNLLGSRTAVTDETGRFQLAALPVGTYQVAARLIGFRPVLIQNVSVRLGETASLPRITLPEAPVELAEITATDTEVGLDPASTASSLRLDAWQLDALPLSRSHSDIALLAPAAIPSYLGQAGGVPDGINIGGATGMENTYYVDGINTTAVVHGGPGLELPYNFLKQIEIRTGGSTAEDAQALGGVINVVTPGGGARLHGGGFVSYTAGGLTTESRALPGSAETGFENYDFGATVGGPVLRNHLWFSAAYNQVSDQLAESFASGPYESASRRHLFAGKLAWQAGPRTSATFTVIGNQESAEYLADSLFGTGVRLDAEGGERKGSGGRIGLSLRASQGITPHLVIEGGVAQLSGDWADEPATAAGQGPMVVDQLNGTIAGGGGGTGSGEDLRRSASLAASWLVGPHALKAGALYERLYVDGRFDESTITRVDTNKWDWHSNRSEHASAENRTPSIFVQDAWQLNPRLLLNLGLRWSQQTVLNPTSGEMNFEVRDGLQPRVGVVFQPGRIGTQRVYAAYGRVANQITLRGIEELNGFGAETVFVFPQDPRVDTTGGIITKAAQWTGRLPGDGTLRGETADEWAIGYDRRLTGTLALTVRAVRRVHRDAAQAGADTLGNFLEGNPGRGALAQYPLPGRSYYALELSLEHAGGPGSPWARLSYVLSRTYGNYPGLYGSDWSLDFGHVGPLYVTPEQQNAYGTGYLPNDRTHVLKLFGALPITSRLVVGASFLLASGTPLSEYGAIPIGQPFRGLASQRGTAGRTPTIWDLGIRAALVLPSPFRSGMGTRLLLDLNHIGSPRTPVDYDQVHYLCLDAQGQQSCPNPGYGRAITYQPPMAARIAIEVGF